MSMIWVQRVMTEEEAATQVTYFQCPNGEAHAWTYPRRGTYRCIKCLMVVTKEDMKRWTDA